MYLPTGDHIENVRAFVNTAVIHDDDRVWLRKGVHLIEQPLNEDREAFHVV